MRVFMNSLHKWRFPTNQPSVLHLFSEILDEKRVRLAGHISWESFKASGARTGDSSSFNLGKRRVGRPRQSLTYNTNEFIRAMRRMI